MRMKIAGTIRSAPDVAKKRFSKKSGSVSEL